MTAEIICPRIDPCREITSVPGAAAFYRPIHRPEVSRKTCLVGFGHRARQGKDTVVAHIESMMSGYPGVTAKRYAFADALKIEVFDFLQNERAMQIMGITRTEWPALVGEPANIFHLPLPSCFPMGTPEGEKLAWVDKNKTQLRKMLQVWGTEYRRHGDPLYWVKQLQTRVERDQPSFALIPDMRFKNEAAICDYTVNVRRKGFTPVGGLHISETEMDDYLYDFVIEAADGDMKGLLNQAQNVFARILEKRGY